MTDYDAVLFDSDGVLVTPPPAASQRAATREAFRACGVEDPQSDHVADLVDGVTVERLGDICAAYGLDREAFWRAREDHDEESQFADFRAGTRTRYDDVTAVADVDPACGVVSNNHHTTIEFVLTYVDLDPHVETYYGREKAVESLRRKKPATHYLDRALADLGAETGLYVGDSEHDVVAAHRAGLDSVFLRRGHCRDVDLSVTPTFEVESLHDVAAIVGE